MQQRVGLSWPELGSLIILHQCCINFTGFRYVSESPSSWLWSPSNAFPVWRCPVLGYLCIAVSSVVGRWQLRSADSRTLVVPRTRTTIGRRDFAVLGSATWNSLPVELRTLSLSFQTFAKEEQLNNWAACVSDDSCLTGATNRVFIHSLPLPNEVMFSLRSVCLLVDSAPARSLLFFVVDSVDSAPARSLLFFMSPLRRHIFVCFMAKSAFWRGFSALAPYTGVGPI